jgi:hypothetical protein
MHVFFKYLIAGEKAALSRFFFSSPKSIKESLETKAKYRLQRRMPKEKKKITYVGRRKSPVCTVYIYISIPRL